METTYPATQPHHTDYPNKPWSLPACANPSPDGMACVMRAHTVVAGVRVHSAQVRDPFIRWVSWHTTDVPAQTAPAI